MAQYVRVQISLQADSALPRDAITINPHFITDDPSVLLNSLASNIASHPPGNANSQFTLKAYDAAKQPPSYPLATVNHGNTPFTSSYPRDLALCLSYYSIYNRPSYRGRLYIPSLWIAGSPGLRPSSADRLKASDWVSILTVGVPTNDKWVVWSKNNNETRGVVSNWWVDDEWDTVRSRGLRATTRTTGTIPP